MLKKYLNEGMVLSRDQMLKIANEVEDECKLVKKIIGSGEMFGKQEVRFELTNGKTIKVINDKNKTQFEVFEVDKKVEFPPSCALNAKALCETIEAYFK